MNSYPPILQRLIEQLKEKGKSEKAATDIALAALRKSGNIEYGSTKATFKGTQRGLMTPGERAMDRDIISKGKNALDYVYNPRTNKMNKR